MVAAHVADTPVWIFHGESDPVVPVEESRKMVAALKQVGASVRYTEYPKVGHNSWDLAFDNEELPQWLLQQKLPAVRKR